MTQNIPNSNKIDQRLPFQDPPKFTQNGILGLKIYMPSGSPARVDFMDVHVHLQVQNTL
jgi:hypothetical protein